MPSRTRRLEASLRALLLCGCLLLLLVSNPATADELPADIIALTGRELPRLRGATAAELAAIAVHAGNPSAVHVQVDQRVRTADGRWQYVFETPAPPQAPNRQEIGDDDLVLLAFDEGGERMQRPPDHATEIEAIATDGSSRWFYVARGSAAALPPLVSYDPVADHVRGQDYVLGFGHDGTPVLDTLVLGDPDYGTNILDRSKARLDLELAAGIGALARTEDDVRVRTTGLHAGPLRILRECEVRGRMLLGLYSPPVRDTFVFYAHGFVLPTTLHLTPTARMLTRRVTLRISMDLIDPSGALTFQSAPDVPTSTVIDGQSGTRDGTRPIAWYLLRREDIGLLGWLKAPDEVARDVTVYYRDDRTHADPPERASGEIGDHGFTYRQVGTLPQGDIHLSSHGWILHGSQLDRPAAELRVIDARPTVRIH